MTPPQEIRRVMLMLAYRLWRWMETEAAYRLIDRIQGELANYRNN